MTIGDVSSRHQLGGLYGLVLYLDEASLHMVSYVIILYSEVSSIYVSMELFKAITD